MVTTVMRDFMADAPDANLGTWRSTGPGGTVATTDLADAPTASRTPSRRRRRIDACALDVP